MRAGDRGWQASVALLGGGLLLGGGAAAAATVVAVESGDTLRVREGGTVRTVRLACLEAPELSQAPHGERAKATLQSLLPVGSAVLLTPIDRASAPPGVTVAEVITSAGNVNLALVRAGQAFTSLDSQPRCDALRYADAENTARFQRLGVWQVEGGIQRPRDPIATDPPRPRDEEPRLRPWRERDAGPARRDIPLPSRQPPSAERGPGSVRVAYAQCLKMARDKFSENNRGMTPPPGLFHGVCTCLSQPKSNDTLSTLSQRCTQGMVSTLYQHCLVSSRKNYQVATGGTPPPPGVMESYCSCLTKPKANDTSEALVNRCLRQLQRGIKSTIQAV